MTKAKTGDTGTLEQLGVQAGDVVEYCGSEYIAFEEPKPRRAVGPWAGTVAGGWLSFDSTCRLISRATSGPTIFDDMTDAEQGALFVAKHRGEEIQVCNPKNIPVNAAHDHYWQEMESVFHGEFAYRVKPNPVVETVTANLNLGNTFCNTHKLTYNRVDGEIDCASAVLVKL